MIPDRRAERDAAGGEPPNLSLDQRPSAVSM